MTQRYKMVRRLTIAGSVVAALLLVDGLILFFTNGLSSDATPVFPVLGGTFAKTHSSGTSLIIMAVMRGIVLAVGWFGLGRKLRDESRAEHGGAGLDVADGRPKHVR